MADALVRVIHRHRIGRLTFTRVSPPTYVAKRPVAVLVWLHQGEGRLPGVYVPLDEARLRPGATRRIFMYDGETTDPRSAPVRPG